MWRRWVIEPLKGKVSLGLAFWGYGLGVSVVYSILVWLLNPTTVPSIVAYTLIGLILGVLQSVILWRCAPNARSAFLGRLVRTVTVVGLILVALMLYVIIKNPEALLLQGMP
jgi:hypothetical protein